jgi:hypothetical protein
MNDFEYLFALFGLLFGLIVAELSLKLADAIEANRERPMGVLTPALAFLIITDLCSFWLFLWGSRSALVVSWRTVFAGVLLAMIYLLAASLTFPRGGAQCAHLDQHYWSHKRMIAAGILFVNIVVTGALLTRSTPAWDDWWFYFYFPSYLLALGGLVFSRSRRVDIVCLAWVVTVNLVGGTDLVHSEFGKATGVVPITARP